MIENFEGFGDASIRNFGDEGREARDEGRSYIQKKEARDGTSFMVEHIGVPHERDDLPVDTGRSGKIKLPLIRVVEHIGVEPMTSCMPCKRSSQLS